MILLTNESPSVAKALNVLDDAHNLVVASNSDLLELAGVGRRPIGAVDLAMR